jgi:hypothetical protein
MTLTNIREIHEPLPITMQTQTHDPLPRRLATQDYVKANQHWWIEVRFDSDTDIALFEKTIRGSPIRFIEFRSRFFIEDPHAPDIEQLAQGLGPVSRYAEDELPRLNAAVKVICPEYVPAKLRCIVYLSENGTGHPITIAEGKVHGTGEFEAIWAFLHGPDTDFPRLFHLYRQNSDLRDALFYFGSEGNPWPNLYKVREIVADALGGDGEIVRRGWCSRNTLERFSRTANHQQAIGKFSRHARTRAQLPPNPLPEAEARNLMRELLQAWTSELLRGSLIV